jgi:hypothetical protein
MENGTDYFRPTDRRILEHKKGCGRIVIRYGHEIRIVINGYGKESGFTSIRPYPKIYRI